MPTEPALPDHVCHACNQPIKAGDLCRGRFGDDVGIRRWHLACFVAIAVAKPER